VSAAPLQPAPEVLASTAMRILLVEDEVRLSSVLARGLREEGHAVDVCERGGDAETQARDVSYDLVVLDWMLPDLDGITLLRRWREAGVDVPVLMLTARGEPGEKVTGLRAGADDYLAKPFDFEELLARLEALHRRRGATPLSRQFGALILDVRRRELVFEDARAPLTAREFGLAAALLEHGGDVLTRAELLASVWGRDFAGEPNVVDVYVGYLRKKLNALGADRAVTIATVRGLGFRLQKRGE
jgi:two-component system OmpR family response regulator